MLRPKDSKPPHLENALKYWALPKIMPYQFHLGRVSPDEARKEPLLLYEETLNSSGSLKLDRWTHRYVGLLNEQAAALFVSLIPYCRPYGTYYCFDFRAILIIMTAGGNPTWLERGNFQILFSIEMARPWSKLYRRNYITTVINYQIKRMYCMALQVQKYSYSVFTSFEA